MDKYDKESFLAQLWDYFIDDLIQRNLIKKSNLSRIKLLFINGIANSGRVCLVGDKWIENKQDYLDKKLYHIYEDGSYRIRECKDILYRIRDYLYLSTCKSEQKKKNIIKR